VPEEMEAQTETVHETVSESIERKGDWLLKAIALTTALLAILATIAALRAAATVNEALMLKAEATRHQAEASDQWAYYQAKGIKAAVQEASRTAWLAIGKEPPADFKEAVKRYADEQQQIEKMARQKEHDRDAKSAEADQLFDQHHRYAISVAIFQVAIALGAVAALTRMRPLWIGSLLLGISGTALLLAVWLR
jgi:type II secretory pathway pseudopilin PulG